MRPILHPRAACVVGHRAKDELTTASGGRQARATAWIAPPHRSAPVQTIVLTSTAAERINDQRQCAAPAIEPDAVGVRRRSRRRVLRAEKAVGSRSRRRSGDKRFSPSVRRRAGHPYGDQAQVRGRVLAVRPRARKRARRVSRTRTDRASHSCSDEGQPFGSETEAVQRWPVRAEAALVAAPTPRTLPLSADEAGA
jgi:hypothetical protein